MSKPQTFSSVAVLALTIYVYFVRATDEGKIIKIKQGLVQGSVSRSRDGGTFYQWLGIPYARPPVGELRFASPMPAESWEGVLDASSFGSPCASISYLLPRVTGEENCLFINVNVPKLKVEPGKSAGPLLPVIVYIHGGAFMQGSSNHYKPDFFMDENVILVTFDYRLGILGFLSTGDESIRGNMGLKDQALAIKWVHDNVQAFGGDPGRVTLFGESAGAASVHYQMLSPQSTGMFQKAAISSAAAGSTWTTIPPEELTAKTMKIAQSLDCSRGNSLKTAECLRKVPVKRLLESIERDLYDYFVFMPHMKRDMIGPTIEKVNDGEAFITQHPVDLLEKGEFQKVPLLAGVMADEGLVSSAAMFVSEENMKLFETSWDDSIARVCLNRTKEVRAAASKIKEFYFFNGKRELTYKEKLPKYTELFSDCFGNIAAIRAAEAHRKFSNVYLFYFNVHNVPSFAGITMYIGSTFNRCLDVMIYVIKSFVMHRILGIVPTDYGVNHGDDLPLMFPQENFWLPEVGKGHPLYQMSKRWVKFLVDYATTEDDVLTFEDVELKPLPRTGPLKFLEVSPSPKVIQNPFQKRMDYLKSIGLH